MRSAGLAGVVLVLLVASIAQPAKAELPQGRGVLLPVQDRVGEETLAQLTETLLQRELEARGSLAETANVRAVLRSLRVRDASYEPQDRLDVLADRLEVDWFFLPTLHEAIRGRASQRGDGVAATGPALDDAADSPQFVLSALVLRRDSSEIWWAGFDASSGRDGERLLGLGEIEGLEELMENAVRRLVAQAAEARAVRGKTRMSRRRGGFVRGDDRPSASARVAVIPMDSISVQDPAASAEVATAVLYAALDEYGFQPLVPGVVRNIREQVAQGQRGAASRPEWEALGRDGRADWVATGTVEAYRGGRGRAPDPSVAVAVRLLGTGDGRIHWLDGIEVTGRDTAAAFDRGRIYSRGDLAHQMIRSMFASMGPRSSVDRAAGGD